MSATPVRVNRAQIGIALDGTLLSAVWGAGANEQWRTLVLPCDGTARSVADTLREVAAHAPARGEVTFTLQRPFASARSVAMPKMRRAELEAVLERDWTRYTIGLRAEPHLAAVAPASASGWWRAAFAPIATLEALEASAREQGWTVREVRTTDDALGAAAREALPTIARIDDAFVASCGATSATDIVHLRLGVPVTGRQLLAGSAAEIATFVRSSLARMGLEAPTPAKRATVILIGDRERGEALARELGKDGLQAQHQSLARPAGDAPTTMLAMAGLLHAAHLPLVAPSERTARLARARLATRWLIAATIALAAAGLGIESHRVQTSLADIARQRAAIASHVSDAVARRAALESATDAASALAADETRASRASATVAAIALALPDNASLSMLQVSGDSVTIEGESDRSADVYAALRAAPTLEAVRLSAPLRQERQANDEPVEHFAFVARLRRSAR